MAIISKYFRFRLFRVKPLRRLKLLRVKSLFRSNNNSSSSSSSCVPRRRAFWNSERRGVRDKGNTTTRKNPPIDRPPSTSKSSRSSMNGKNSDHRILAASDMEVLNRNDNNNSCSNHKSMHTSKTVDIDEDEETTPPITSAVATKKRRVSFRLGLAEAIHEIPHRVEYEEKNLKEELFYGDADYERFRASELKRHEKMVAKKIQKMVMEQMQPKINEAVAKGASLDDIEAMVPKTHAEMVAYLGGEENIRKMVEANSFGGLERKKKEKTIPSSQPPSAKSTGCDEPSDSKQQKSENNSEPVKEVAIEKNNENDNGNEIETGNNSKIASKTSSSVRRKRTIRSTRSSIQVRPRTKGLKYQGSKWKSPLSGIEAEVVAASEELRAQEENEAEDEKQSSKKPSASTATSER